MRKEGAHAVGQRTFVTQLGEQPAALTRQDRVEHGQRVTVGVVDDPVFAAYAVSALVVPGVFVMVHLGRSWLAAHLALALVTVVVLCARVIATMSRIPSRIA